MNKTAFLSSSLIARKGEAIPSSAPVFAPTAKVMMPRGTADTVAVTVRLDPARYESLKFYGVRQRKTNQEILVEALDAFLKSVS